LPDWRTLRDLDKFERGFVQVPLERLVSVEIAVRLLDDDMSFQQEAFEQLLESNFGYGHECPQSDVLRDRENGIVSIGISNTRYVMRDSVLQFRHREAKKTGESSIGYHATSSPARLSRFSYAFARMRNREIEVILWHPVIGHSLSRVES